MNLDEPHRDYFAERSHALRAAGFDPDDDDDWARPDNELHLTRRVWDGDAYADEELP